MRRPDSLPATYFEEMFAGDPDPWRFETSAYEQAKYAHTLSVLGPSYRRGFEIGCANGVLTAQLSARCRTLLSIDVSETALARARERCAGAAGASFARMSFPQEAPETGGFDLLVLSEVAYYWSDADLDKAAGRIAELLAPGGEMILVHWTGETDYPQSGDGAVSRLERALAGIVAVRRSERTKHYRLDLWARRAP